VRLDADAAEAACREQYEKERSYRRMLADTDLVLGQLEQRNLAGQRDLDRVMRQNLVRMLNGLPQPTRARFPAAGGVQEALDGVFDVQADLLVVLQRMVHWDRLLMGPWEQEESAAPARRSA